MSQGCHCKRGDLYKAFFNLFRNKPSTSASAEPPEDRSTVKIDLKAKSRKGKEIADILNELTVDDGDNDDEEDDLLALMDKAK